MGSVRIDPYFYKQPPLLFVEELRKPVHTEKPAWFCRTEPAPGEISAMGTYLVNEFPDEEKLLETAVADWNIFLQVYGIAGDRYPVRLVRRNTDCFEAYKICVEENGCTVEAEDTEGIRRALIYLEDEMQRREGAILPRGEISKKPYIRTRITRGFFSPTNRPPKNQDELLDDIDYYPDEYLNRLAHDGTNGLWIYTYFNNLMTSDIFTEYGKDSQKRIQKLKKVVDKCKRYGVKVYVFGVEPFAMDLAIADKYDDALGGVTYNGRRTICTYSQKGADYCIEVTQKIMEQIPDLGGIIDITYGERPTTCASLQDYCVCPRCKNRSRSEILAHNIDLLKEGIRRAGSKADFVSWTYAHRLCPMEEIKDYVRRAPSDVVLMENFEDGGYTMQLGKMRQAIDYWLSYKGPSQMYQGAAETALAEGKTMFAKMQVCCSHELATVPYIPAPGILFDKYAAARKYKVEGVMQCWYFGNYPSLMSKAAGELSFVGEFARGTDTCDSRESISEEASFSKDAFLMHLAGIYYGGRAKEAVEAWKHFEESYTDYPVNIMFSYYGPMHDGVVWELALQPKDRSLSRSWLLMDKPDGDRIGECLQAGHTLEEAVILTTRMRENWRKGLDCIPDNGPAEQLSVAGAVNLLIASASNILRFYELRSRLAVSCAECSAEDAASILQEMECIVDDEIQNSRKMIPLCEADSRLGYHSEAEGYKFFPEKLEDRIRKLEQLRASEFEAARQNLANGMSALPWYEGQNGPSYKMRKGLVTEASYEEIRGTEASKAFFRAAYDDEYLYMELQGKADTEFKIYFEYEPMWPSPGINIKNGLLELTQASYTHQSVWGEKADRELGKYELTLAEPETGHYILAVSRKRCGWITDRPLRARISADLVSWIYDDDPVRTLGKHDASPGEFGWLMPELYQQYLLMI